MAWAVFTTDVDEPSDLVIFMAFSSPALKPQDTSNNHPMDRIVFMGEYYHSRQQRATTPTREKHG
jgi:hypothetical protein